MHEKASIPIELLDTKASSPLKKIYFELVHLKQLYRAGWLRQGVPKSRCESVADHSYGTAMLCLLFLDQHPGLDVGKTLKLALLHDLGECYVGDYTPHDDIDPGEKKAVEADAVKKVLGKLPGDSELIGLWQEYADQSSAEARFVRQVDRLEMAMQGSVYQHQGVINAEEFFQSARKVIDDENLLREMDGLHHPG
jgi:putative hydrolase of HD superfamily